MTKIALITDTHYGIKSDDPIFLKKTEDFMKDVFFPYLEYNKIWTIVHLGDLVDKRKNISFETAKILRRSFIDKIVYGGYEYHHILGNHDVVYKNTNKVNALNELYKEIIDTANFYVYDKATEVSFDGTKILFVPWICSENEEHSYNLIKTTTAPICLGHLAIQGFEMFKGVVATHGDNADIYKGRFDLVCSGHFHRKSSDSSIHYLGSHSQFTWADYGDRRGFHILDTDTRELEFIANPHSMFEKIYYDDTKTIDLKFEPNIKDKMCKVIVMNKKNPYQFDKFIEDLENQGAIEIQIIDEKIQVDTDTIETIEQSDSSGENKNIFEQYIQENVSDNINKTKLHELMISLHDEAVRL